jgi:transcriptional regulator with XRE-family HTH domain
MGMALVRSTAMRKRVTYRGIAATRLEKFIRARNLTPAQVGRASCVHRARLQIWRRGAASPTLSSIRKLVQGMRKLTDDLQITANDLFPLDDDG